MRFNAPPSWPPPDQGWIPEEGWRPDPNWPAAPDNWAFWVDDHQRPTPGPRGLYGGQRSKTGKRKLLVGIPVAFLLGLGAASVGDEAAPQPTTAASISTVTATASPNTVTERLAGPEITVTGEESTQTVTETAQAATVTTTQTIQAAPETATVTSTETIQAAPETATVTSTETIQAAPATVTVTSTGSIQQFAVVPSDDEDSGGDVYYDNCDDARASGAAPVRVGDPGYRAGLDGDGDGVGCES